MIVDAKWPIGTAPKWRGRPPGAPILCPTPGAPWGYPWSRIGTPCRRPPAPTRPGRTALAVRPPHPAVQFVLPRRRPPNALPHCSHPQASLGPLLAVRAFPCSAVRVRGLRSLVAHRHTAESAACADSTRSHRTRGSASASCRAIRPASASASERAPDCSHPQASLGPLFAVRAFPCSQRRKRYCAFFTKWRGEMPMSSSRARTIGVAPTI